MVHTVIGKAIERRFHPPAGVRFANAFIETSFPTILLLFLAGSMGAAIALNSPLTMLYFVFISLSTLRLAAPLSIFTGCVAAAEFTGLGLYLLGASSSSPSNTASCCW